MNFVKYDGKWYKKSDNGDLYHYEIGWMFFKANDIEIEQSIECDSWHELYLKTDFTIGDLKTSDAWLSPQGELFYCDGHYTGAKQIMEVVFGETNYGHFLTQADDVLHKKGWIKLTTSSMWRAREQDTTVLCWILTCCQKVKIIKNYLIVT